MLIGLNGDAGAGKNAVADHLVSQYGFKQYAFADAVRDVALAIDPIVATNSDSEPMRLSSFITEPSDWDWAKREVPEVRRLLQVVGTEAGRRVLGENCWVDIVHKKIHADWDGKPLIFSHAVVTDLRFENEYDFIKENNGIVIRIERANNPHAIPKTHASEQYVPDADFLIENDGALSDLYMKIDDVVSLWQAALTR